MDTSKVIQRPNWVSSSMEAHAIRLPTPQAKISKPASPKAKRPKLSELPILHHQDGESEAMEVKVELLD